MMPPPQRNLETLMAPALLVLNEITCFTHIYITMDYQYNNSVKFQQVADQDGTDNDRKNFNSEKTGTKEQYLLNTVV